MLFCILFDCCVEYLILKESAKIYKNIVGAKCAWQLLHTWNDAVWDLPEMMIMGFTFLGPFIIVAQIFNE